MPADIFGRLTPEDIGAATADHIHTDGSDHIHEGLLTPEEKAKVAAFSDYAHTQSVSSSTWTISHNLGRHPAITVVDSAGSVVVGAARYIDANTVEVSFSAPFSGKAYLT